jgi:hypothetical protein
MGDRYQVLARHALVGYRGIRRAFFVYPQKESKRETRLR